MSNIINICVVLFVIYVVGDWLNTKRLTKKLGAKPITHSYFDYFFGFKRAYEFLKLKSTGELIDYTYTFLQETVDADTVDTRLAGRAVLLTKDPENIKALLATQFNDYSLGIRHAQFLPLLGDGIFTLDGEGWKQSRAMLRPQFAREQVAHVQALEPHVQDLANQIRNKRGEKFDIQELFFRLTVDSATEFLFGESVNTLKDEAIGYPTSSNDIEGKAEFAESFNASQKRLADRAVFQDLYWLINDKKFRENNKNVHKLTDYYVKRALNMSNAELNKHSAEGYTFLYELVQHTRNPKVLRDQALNILLAGRDTTAGLLSFVFFELAKNPTMFEKLKNEIYETFGRGESARIDEITFESLKKCEYLKAFINETLRLYPSVPQNFRVATKNTTLPRGGGENGEDPILVRKGQIVSYFVFATHRDPRVYGKDATTFRPERWFEPETRKLGWSFVPFNGGPRICLGQQFALTEASYVVTRLLQMFDTLEGFDEIYPPKKSSHLTMCLQDGCNISFT
jgi:cytochrome P450